MFALIDSVSLTDVILIAVIVGAVVARVAEGRGWFQSAAGLRTENTDLIRRNAELEETIARHNIELAANTAKIAVLEAAIHELEKLDQSAVLKALKDHEVGAVGRAERTHELQTETNAALDKIVAVLETPTNGGTT